MTPCERFVPSSAISVRNVAWGTIRDTYGDLITDDNGRFATLNRRCSPRPTRKRWMRNSNCGRAFPTKKAASWKMSLFTNPAKPASARSCLSNRTISVLPPVARQCHRLFLPRRPVHCGAKVHRMSVAQAMEFYGPVREVLRTKLKDMSGPGPKPRWKEFGFKIPATEEKQLGETSVRPSATINSRISSVSCPAMRRLNCRARTGTSRHGKVHRTGL